MIRVTTFAGKTVAVFGLGGSGVSAARALLAGGAHVAAWDDSAAGREAAVKAGLPLVDLANADWSQLAALVLAPGVPLTHPEPHWVVNKASAAGVEIIGDVELFFRTAPRDHGATTICITGTNGKSTTTALVAHILRRAGCDVQMGGNIGVPILALEPPVKDRIYVIEMSSFQIELTPSLAPDIGVLLNITPDHLDRHGTMQHYVELKTQLPLASQEAVVCIDDAWCSAVADLVAKQAKTVWRVTTLNPDLPLGVVATGEKVMWRSNNQSRYVWDIANVASLRGQHNAQNAAAAAAALSVAGSCGIDAAVVQAAFRTFPGLPHRMEQVGALAKPAGGRILFINDSKATNADSTEKALLSFAGDIHWIVGGKPKQGGIAELAPLFPRIAKAYLIGASTDEFAATLEGKVAYDRCENLDQAIANATQDALNSSATEPCVLLSPACASYDQFKNFEVRGDSFRKLVHHLISSSPPGLAGSPPGLPRQ